MPVTFNMIGSMQIETKNQRKDAILKIIRKLFFASSRTVIFTDLVQSSTDKKYITVAH